MIRNAFNFGSGTGEISQSEQDRRNEIATRHDAEFYCVRGNNRGQCTCGHGCRSGQCSNQTWWFAAENKGEPFNGRVEREVMAEVDAA